MMCSLSPRLKESAENVHTNISSLSAPNWLYQVNSPILFNYYNKIDLKISPPNQASNHYLLRKISLIHIYN